MKKFVLLPKIKNDNDIKRLRNLYDQIESSVRNLQTLKVDTNSYASLLMPLINEKLPTDIRVIVARIEAKERSLSVSTLFVDKQENEFSFEKFSSSALYSNHKSFVKSSKQRHLYFAVQNIYQTDVFKFQKLQDIKS